MVPDSYKKSKNFSIELKLLKIKPKFLLYGWMIYSANLIPSLLKVSTVKVRELIRKEKDPITWNEGR